MSNSHPGWTVLVYKIPSNPSRLRLLIWRKLQRMGAIYLQDAVCIVPSRPDLDENMQYIAAQIEEMGGTCYLFSASALLPGSVERLIGEFQSQADDQLERIVERLAIVTAELVAAVTPAALENAEGELKRERVSYLRARRLAYFGSTKEDEVDTRLDAIKRSLDELYRSGK